MGLDPRTPVLVGAGQVNRAQRTPELEPVDLMAMAAREAADPRVLQAVDAIRVVNLLSWRYRDPGLLLGARIGAANAATYYTGIGGNTPQSLVNQACLDIQARPRRRGAAGRRRDLAHPDAAAGQGYPPGLDAAGRLRARCRRAPSDEVPMSGPAEDRIGLDRALVRLPAVRAGAAHRRRRVGATTTAGASASCGRGSARWPPTTRTPGVREALPAEQIWQPGPDNRMISWPYPKLMNSNNMVDQAAVVMLCSAEKATYLQIPRDQWVFPYAGHRLPRHLLRSPSATNCTAPRRSGSAARRVLELAGVGVDDLDYVDVYSCFPSAVQVAAGRTGPARRTTRSGR